jgi:hypothetical protein
MLLNCLFNNTTTNKEKEETTTLQDKIGLYW